LDDSLRCSYVDAHYPLNEIQNLTDEEYSNDIKKSMKHTIEFHTEEDPNELQLIKTIIGTGKIDSMSINLDTRLAKANLMYRPK
jgi:pentose-5-phosphate-3-epimerase